jgi:hypothetical protein
MSKTREVKLDSKPVLPNNTWLNLENWEERKRND